MKRLFISLVATLLTTAMQKQRKGVSRHGGPPLADDCYRSEEF